MHLEISKYHKIISANLKDCKSRAPTQVVVERLPTTPPPPFPPPSPTPALYENNVNKNFKLPVDLIAECLKRKTCLLHSNKSWEIKVNKKSSYGESTRELKWRYITAHKKSSDHEDWYDLRSRDQN